MDADFTVEEKEERDAQETINSNSKEMKENIGQNSSVVQEKTEVVNKANSSNQAGFLPTHLVLFQIENILNRNDRSSGFQ